MEHIYYKLSLKPAVKNQMILNFHDNLIKTCCYLTPDSRQNLPSLCCNSKGLSLLPVVCDASGHSSQMPHRVLAHLKA